MLPALGIGHLPDTSIKLILMGLVVLLVGIYAWSTIDFRLRFGNLSYRGMITRGPYCYCCHPAYAAKCLSWWVQFFLGLTSYVSIVGMLGWMFIYCLRALTEEQSHDDCKPKMRSLHETSICDGPILKRHLNQGLCL